MPVTLSQIANNTASVVLHYLDNDVQITYYPSRVTEKTFASLKQFDQMNQDSIIQSFNSLNDVLANLIQSWDLYEDDDQTIMFPIDAERMKDLPIAFRMSALGSIMEDIRPNQMASQTSN